MRIVTLLSGLLTMNIAFGGVSHGNPKRGEFFNMKSQYKVIGSENWAFFPQESANFVKVILPIRYGLEDAFYIVDRSSTLAVPTGKTCLIKPVTNSEIDVYWISRDCNNERVRMLFDVFYKSVSHFSFSN